MSPFEATQQFPLALFRLAKSRERENKKFLRVSSPRYTIGDVVRLKIQNNGWRKGTLKKFTNEVYRITRVRKTPYKYIYTVETIDAHMLKPAVNENEHRVEVLGERVRNGNREIRVDWDGYDQSAVSG